MGRYHLKFIPIMSKKLSVFTLAMINVAAVSSVRNLPTIAEYGFASLFYFALAAVLFFIPVSMVAAELSTGWPKTGGVFIWVKEAFGHRTGFLAVWLLWAENLVYYPALISFIAGTVAYVFDPALSHSTLYVLGFIVILFWATTLANLLGMRASGWISTFGVIAGTIIPGGLIILLGLLWYFMGNPMQISFTMDSLIPTLHSPGELVFFSGVLVSLCGLEMSAVHARDVENPQKKLPQGNPSFRHPDPGPLHIRRLGHCGRRPAERNQPCRRIPASLFRFCQCLWIKLANARYRHFAGLRSVWNT